MLSRLLTNILRSMISTASSFLPYRRYIMLIQAKIRELAGYIAYGNQLQFDEDEILNLDGMILSDREVMIYVNRQLLTTITTRSEVTGNLNLNDCSSLAVLPDGLHVGGSLNLAGCTALSSLPDGLRVDGNLFLRGCTSLSSLSDGLHVEGSLNLEDCTALSSLSDGLHVGRHLHFRGCTSLSSLPDGLHVGGNLFLRGCTALSALPDDLHVDGTLDLRGCTGLIQTARLTQKLHNLAEDGCIVIWPEHFINAPSADINRKIEMETRLAVCENKILADPISPLEPNEHLKCTLKKLCEKYNLSKQNMVKIGLYAEIIESNEIPFFKNYIDRNIRSDLNEFLNRVEPLIEMIENDPQNLILVDEMIRGRADITPEELVSNLQGTQRLVRRSAFFEGLGGSDRFGETLPQFIGR